jgi:hypothetical protein
LLSLGAKKCRRWDAALLDAKEQKAELEKKLARMSATVKVIEKMIEDGEPWAGPQPDATRN